MKPVNLLPEQHRPSRPSGGRSGIAYVVLGGLVVVLVAVLALVLTSNEISSKQQRATELEQQTAAAEAQAGSLGPVANFLSIKQSREQSVRDLAGRRFDWERLTRELAKVIPAGLYVTDFSASVDGTSGTTSAAATPAAATPGAAPAGPKLSVSGCARNQPQVATFLVRLKQLNLAQDAELEESKRVGAATDGAAQESSGSAGIVGVGATCHGYQFKASVTFDPASVAMGTTTGAKPESVPAALGGGK